MVSNVVDHMQRFQQHACCWAHACNLTHSTHSPRRRQEASLTRAEHVLQQVDVYDHQHTLEDQHRHYASVCCWFNRTQEDHVHVSRRVGWKGSNQCTNCNGDKSSLQQDVTMRCMQTIMNNQAWHQLTTFTITSMSKSWPHHNGLSVSDVLHGFLKPCCLTWVHVHCNVESCQV